MSAPALSQQTSSPQVVPVPGRNRRRRNPAASWDKPGWLSYLVLTLAVIAFAYPLWWSFVVASGTNATRSEAFPLIPGPNFMKNVDQVLQAIPFWKALGNSLVISTVVTISVVSFSTLAGYAFAKLKFKGRDKLMVFVIATMAIPTQLGIIPLFMIMRELDWTGQIQAVIIPILVTAFGVFFMRQYLAAVVPDELIEAARMDGCNQFRTFLNVAVPAGRPAMAILALFTFMMAWTDFLWPLIVLNASNPTLQTALSQLQSGYYVDYSIVLAGAVMATLPLLVLFFLAGKQLISGIMQGGVKG